MEIQGIGALKFSWFKSHHRYRSHPSSCSVAESLGCFFIRRELFCSVCADECYLIRWSLSSWVTLNVLTILHVYLYLSCFRLLLVMNEIEFSFVLVAGILVETGEPFGILLVRLVHWFWILAFSCLYIILLSYDLRNSLKFWYVTCYSRVWNFGLLCIKLSVSHLLLYDLKTI